MRFYILTSIILLLTQAAYALDVVYPKKNTVTIQSPSTFFVGSASVNTPLKINGEVVPVHTSGGFAKAVKLEYGKNRFVIEQNGETKVFEITNPRPQNTNSSSCNLVEYKNKLNYATTKDWTPLRSTPVDGGINRIAHYSAGMPLSIDGEKNGFYRVILNNERTAWIAKNDVVSIEGNPPAKLLDRTVTEDNDFYIFNIKFDKKTPYVIEGGYPFIVNFYNVKDYENNTYSFNFPLKQKLAGYSGKFEGNTFVLKIRKFPQINDENPLKNIKITLYAGHGGDEIGAIGCLRHKEKEINLAITKNLYDELKARGANVMMTRSGDDNVGLYDRVEIANKNDSMMFISIHGNALPDNADPLQNSGTSIYYYYNQSKPLADSIMRTMMEQLSTNDDKVRKGSLAVVRNTEALSILIEVAYLINPDDNAKLINKEFQKQTAKAIADGIEEYLKN